MRALPGDDAGSEVRVEDDDDDDEDDDDDDEEEYHRALTT